MSASTFRHCSISRPAGNVFAEVSGLYPINVNLTGSDEPERIEMQLVSASYFRALGVGAQIGRTFDASDYHPGIAKWPSSATGCGRAASAAANRRLADKIRLDNDLFTIIGVMPPTFHHPGRGIAGEAEIWAPSGYRSTPFRTPTRGDQHARGCARASRGRRAARDGAGEPRSPGR